MLSTDKKILPMFPPEYVALGSIPSKTEKSLKVIIII